MRRKRLSTTRSPFSNRPCGRIPRPRPDRRKLAEAVGLLKTAKKPLVISGGGVRYSLAERVVADFAVKRGLPIVETIAGKGSVTHDHPAHAGPIGIVGSTSANALAEEADVIIGDRHPAAGFLDRVVDGLPKRRKVYCDQRCAVRRGEAPVGRRRR